MKKVFLSRVLQGFSPSLFNRGSRVDTRITTAYVRYSYFEKGCREKMRTLQSRKVIWDMINTLFLTLKLSNLLFFFWGALTNIRLWPLVWFFQICLKNSELKTTHNTSRDCSRALFPSTFLEIAVYKILTWLRWKVKIAIFSLVHFLAIPRRDLSSKKAKPNIEKWPESLGLMLEFQYIKRGLLFLSLTKKFIKKCGARAELMFYLLI